MKGYSNNVVNVTLQANNVRQCKYTVTYLVQEIHGSWDVAECTLTDIQSQQEHHSRELGLFLSCE